MRKSFLRRFTASFMCLVTFFGCLTGCSKPNDSVNEEPKLPWNAFDISEYSIVYAEGLDEKSVSRAHKLAEALDQKWGSAPQVSDDSVPDDGGKEILIGMTNREFSENVATKLDESKHGDGKLSSQVQHFLEINSKGERKPRHLRGREFMRCTT